MPDFERRANLRLFSPVRFARNIQLNYIVVVWAEGLLMRVYGLGLWFIGLWFIGLWFIGLWFIGLYQSLEKEEFYIHRAADINP